MENITFSPIAEACADAVDNLADALLDNVWQCSDVEHVAGALDAMFNLADVTERITNGPDANTWVTMEVLPSRPTTNPEGYEAYLYMLALAANHSARFMDALQDFACDPHNPPFQRNFAKSVLRTASAIGAYSVQ